MCVLIHTYSVQSPDDNRSRKHMQDKRQIASIPGLITSCIGATLASATTINKNHTAWICFKKIYSGREAVPAAPWNCRLQKPILADIATRVHGTCQVANFCKCSSFASLASNNHDFWGACFHILHAISYWDTGLKEGRIHNSSHVYIEMWLHLMQWGENYNMIKLPLPQSQQHHNNMDTCLQCHTTLNQTS